MLRKLIVIIINTFYIYIFSNMKLIYLWARIEIDNDRNYIENYSLWIWRDAHQKDLDD